MPSFCLKVGFFSIFCFSFWSLPPQKYSVYVTGNAARVLAGHTEGGGTEAAHCSLGTRAQTGLQPPPGSETGSGLHGALPLPG